MNSENFVLFAIIGIVLLVGVIGLSSNSLSNDNLAGNSYKKLQSASRIQSVDTTELTSASKNSGLSRISTSDMIKSDSTSLLKENSLVQTINSGEEKSEMVCSEGVEEGANKYLIAGVSFVYVEGDERNPITTRRYADFCKKIDNELYLIEYSCNEEMNGYVKEEILCDCYKGTCDYIPPVPPVPMNCTDTDDNGIVATIYGVTYGTGYETGMPDTCGVGTASGKFTGMMATSCTATEMAITGNTCGVLDHECVNNTVTEGFVVCDFCSNGICSN